MNAPTTIERATPASQQSLGIVSFLNALPLREGLGERPGVSLRPAVPSALIRMVLSGECGAALLPVVDFLRNSRELSPISDACIASDGETLTVRVFSKIPAEKISALCVDSDSHTSIMLARVIWQEMYGRRLELVPWEPARPNREGRPGDDSEWQDIESILLIGDKVVQRAPRGFGFEVDLGAAWKHLTGLPFVFAAWYARRGVEDAGLAGELEAARDRGVRNAREIATQAAAGHGWPVEIAIKYLCEIMKYRITEPMRAGMTRFFELIERHGFSA